MLGKFLNVLDRVFTDYYASKASTENNFVMVALYRISYPVAQALIKLGFTPNSITGLSILFSLGAALSIIYDLPYGLFFTFWTTSILLDFCDGTVARITKRFSNHAVDIDHLSDLLKIFIIILSSAYAIDSKLIWVISSISVFGLLVSDLLNTTLDKARARPHVLGGTPSINVVSPSHATSKLRMIRSAKIKNFVKNCYTICSTINGHTLLIFLLFPVHANYALVALLYLILIELWAIKNFLNVLFQIRSCDRPSEKVLVP